MFGSTVASIESSHLQDTNYSVEEGNYKDARSYLLDQGLNDYVGSTFLPVQVPLNDWHLRVVKAPEGIVAICVYCAPSNINAPAKVFIHVRSDFILSNTIADHLLNVAIERACKEGPTTIELANVIDQTMLFSIAISRGFSLTPDGRHLIKIALGQPLTASNWRSMARKTHRRTGLILPTCMPATDVFSLGITVQRPDGTSAVVTAPALETVLGPTIIVWPERQGAIVSIAKLYADDLLGTGAQTSLFGAPEAAFVFRRTYFSSPRTARVLRHGTPLLFYESLRTKGRGAVIALARIVDIVIVSKAAISCELLRRGVVFDLAGLSASTEVLATSFDNLLRFPQPVSKGRLEALGFTSSSNFQTATAVNATHLSEIVESGWRHA